MNQLRIFRTAMTTARRRTASLGTAARYSGFIEARAVLEVVALDNPPLRLLLGKDALTHADRACGVVAVGWG